jgi:hypothetical protein
MLAAAACLLAKSLSNELQVTPQTPPVFLFHTTADATLPAEMHIYEHDSHSVGLAPQDPVLSTWPDRLAAWLRSRGLPTK